MNIYNNPTIRLYANSKSTKKQYRKNKDAYLLLVDLEKKERAIDKESTLPPKQKNAKKEDLLKKEKYKEFQVGGRLQNVGRDAIKEKYAQAVVNIQGTLTDSESLHKEWEKAKNKILLEPLKKDKEAHLLLEALSGNKKEFKELLGLSKPRFVRK